MTTRKVHSLTKEEISVLNQVLEGVSNPSGIVAFVNLDIAKIKKIMKKLHKLGFIGLTIKKDKYYDEKFWDAEITEKGRKTVNE